jgi:hypothetical protein
MQGNLPPVSWVNKKRGQSEADLKVFTLQHFDSFSLKKAGYVV